MVNGGCSLGEATTYVNNESALLVRTIQIQQLAVLIGLPMIALAQLAPRSTRANMFRVSVPPRHSRLPDIL